MCYEQPQELTSSTSILTLNPFKSDEPTVDGTRHTYVGSQQPPSLSPLDFGDKPLLGNWPYQRSPKLSPSHVQRPSIGAPQPFRHLDHTDAQRKGLIPLRLGPVVLRESPITPSDGPALPDSILNRDRGRSDSMEDLLADDVRPRSYRENRDSPFQRCQQQSAAVRAPSLQQVQPVKDEEIAAVEVPTPVRPSLSSKSSSGSLHRPEAETPSPSIRPRTSSERTRLKPKHSFPLVWKTGSDRLEQEILELNTIVEERRAEAGREKTEGQHVPAVAPSMQVRARSETLNSIGSALSRPLATPNTGRKAEVYNATVPERLQLRRSTSLSSCASSSLSGWLSENQPSSSPGQLPNGEPFYQCQLPRQPRRTHSEASTNTSLTGLESPSLTVASSPTSQGHSRNLTDDSRMTTPLSPSILGDGGHGKGTGKTEKKNRWPFATMQPTEVGLAF